MIFLLFFALVYFLLALAGLWYLYRGYRRRGPLRTVLLGVFGLAGLALLVPLPIHGGFTFLFEALLSELSTYREAVEEVGVQVERRAFEKKLESRFAGPLDYTVVDEPAPGWERVRTPAGVDGFHERASGLVWSELLARGEVAPFELERAKEICRGLPPAGTWALPTSAEWYFFRKAKGERVAPDEGYGTVSFTVDTEMGLELPTTHLGQGRKLALRCVARTGAAPARGYIRDDVPLEEWNRDQLELLR